MFSKKLTLKEQGTLYFLVGILDITLKLGYWEFQMVSFEEFIKSENLNYN